ncbi:hypothetical protein STEG23_016150 [Scotinomys teguina]
MASEGGGGIDSSCGSNRVDELNRQCWKELQLLDLLLSQDKNTPESSNATQVKRPCDGQPHLDVTHHIWQQNRYSNEVYLEPGIQVSWYQEVTQEDAGSEEGGH